MSYKALYRTYRPSSFEEVVGQKHIVATLKNAVKQNKIAHAYLFCGPRGTGKTSIAKLLAKAVNCENHEQAPCNVCQSCVAIQQGNHPDIVEIDAASNNGVDEVRDLIEKVKYAPLEGRYKVYIIDEVHMMSSGAFNALLKTLEEPPAHVIFILATTEPQKVLPTIISRCQRYDFTKVSQSEIIQRLETVMKQEHIQIEDEALRLIAQLADGGMRDALSILDQCIAYAQNNITAVHVNEIYGITTIREKIEILMWTFKHQAQPLLEKIRTLNEKGVDIKRLTQDLLEILKECVIYTYTQDAELLSRINAEEAGQILTDRSSHELLALIDILMDTTEKYRTAGSAASYFEVAVLKMMAELEPSAAVKTTLAEVKSQSTTQAQKSETENSAVLPSVTAAPSVMAPDLASLGSQASTIISAAVVPQETETVDLTEEEPPLPDDPGMPELSALNQKVQKSSQEAGVFPEKEIQPLAQDFVLSLMASGKKEIRIHDDEVWRNVDQKCRDRDLACARTANLLKNGKIIASSDHFILLSVPYQALANEINDPLRKQELTQFCIENLNLKKHLFAIAQEQAKIDMDEFRVRLRSQTLPPPIQLDPIVVELREADETETDENPPILEKLIDLFGEENVEIVEEEQTQ